MTCENCHYIDEDLQGQIRIVQELEARNKQLEERLSSALELTEQLYQDLGEYARPSPKTYARICKFREELKTHVPETDFGNIQEGKQ